MANVQHIIPLILKQEGGLSRALTDTASAHPAPWEFNSKTGWHTNKGVTYTTFSSLAPKLGYAITADNFFTMPEPIWVKIFKNGYWDPMHCDEIKSQAMADAIVDYAWAFGVGGATSRIKKWLSSTYAITANSNSEIATAINALTAKNEEDTFSKFMIHRKAAFAALKQPANEKGWFARMDALTKQGLSILSDNKGTTAIVFFLVWLRFAITTVSL